MTAINTSLTLNAWHIAGILGGLLFYSRFYVQWYYSEREGRSVMPEVFWHMSTTGSAALLLYAVVTRSPLGVLGQSFNMVVYARNLILIWRQQRQIPRWLNHAIHGAVTFVTVIALSLAASIWLGEFRHNQTLVASSARENWTWLGVGVAGQVLFAGRSLVQWIATERQGTCVVPPAFWRLSVAASLLQALSYAQRSEWVFSAGALVVLIVYIRNLALTRSPSSSLKTDI